MVTKRTKNLKKQEIPSLDDPISKLNHIGKETVKKLNELKAAADESNVDLPIPSTLWRCMTTGMLELAWLSLVSSMFCVVGRPASCSASEEHARAQDIACLGDDLQVRYSADSSLLPASSMEGPGCANA